jgi:hypothetical protein
MKSSRNPCDEQGSHLPDPAPGNVAGTSNDRPAAVEDAIGVSRSSVDGYISDRRCHFRASAPLTVSGPPTRNPITRRMPQVEPDLDVWAAEDVLVVSSARPTKLRPPGPPRVSGMRRGPAPCAAAGQCRWRRDRSPTRGWGPRTETRAGPPSGGGCIGGGRVRPGCCTVRMMDPRAAAPRAAARALEKR